MFFLLSAIWISRFANCNQQAESGQLSVPTGSLQAARKVHESRILRQITSRRWKLSIRPAAKSCCGSEPESQFAGGIFILTSLDWHLTGSAQISRGNLLSKQIGYFSSSPLSSGRERLSARWTGCGSAAAQLQPPRSRFANEMDTRLLARDTIGEEAILHYFNLHWQVVHATDKAAADDSEFCV